MLKKRHAKFEIVRRHNNGAASALKFWAMLGQNLNSWWCVKNSLAQPGLNFKLMAAPVNIV